MAENGQNDQKQPKNGRFWLFFQIFYQKYPNFISLCKKGASYRCSIAIFITIFGTSGTQAPRRFAAILNQVFQNLKISQRGVLVHFSKMTSKLMIFYRKIQKISHFYYFLANFHMDYAKNGETYPVILEKVFYLSKYV